MKGMKIRDEFICPITYELMREPVVASDGHTYEKCAIEKWLTSSKISPRAGDPIDSHVIPNINLKKLIQDIINEGGAGFYTKDCSDQERLFDVRPEKILLLECLGPLESEWNQRSFQVNYMGCVGGRRHQLEDNEAGQSKEVVLFRDNTVSRRHFEITQMKELSPCGGAAATRTSYFIRDLGSAGGTFIRIPFGKRKQLHPGMIILLGKHQFTVSSIDDGPSLSQVALSASQGKDRASASPTLTGKDGKEEKGFVLQADLQSVIQCLVQNTEKIISEIKESSTSSSSGSKGSGDGQITAKLRSLSLELSTHLGGSADNAGKATKRGVDEGAYSSGIDEDEEA
jgi:pSer/pThr/pTyr-binding forkhead associated (FHA) protein